MKTMRLTALGLLALGSACLGAIPLPSSPSWSSTDRGYCTGGAFGDIDGDGMIDLAVGVGNDMEWNYNRCYMNRGGTLETSASWHSDEQGQFGHVSLGDVNNDGRPDLAVTFLGYGATVGQARVYLNAGGALETSPSWASADSFNSFDCDFGDMDGDGDLDLAVAAGDAYTNKRSPARVYRNNGGVFEALPGWTSVDSTPGDAIRWADLDGDGRLDLVYGQYEKVSIFRNGPGGLAATPCQVLTDQVGWVLRLAVGDVDRDGRPEVALASNAQIKYPYSYTLFRNLGDSMEASPSWTIATSGNYASCLAFGDADGDGWMDLATGGWWMPLSVYQNSGGSLGTGPAWQWNSGNTLVAESILWGDVRGSHLRTAEDTASGDGNRKLWLLNRSPLQSLEGVSVDGAPLPDSSFCYNLLGSWVSLGQAPGEGQGNVIIRYVYSEAPDLAVTNWDPDFGNKAFLNTTTGVEQGPGSRPEGLPSIGITVAPNPCQGHALMTYRLAEDGPVSMRLYNLSGQLVMVVAEGFRTAGTHTVRVGMDGLSDGVYLASFSSGGRRTTARLVKLR